MGKPPHPAFYDGSMERNRGGRPRHPDVLTPAEWRVLEALREGGTNAEIAERLGVSANTVRYHVSNMLAKLELRDRRALAAWRPEPRRRRLGGLLMLPAALWSVGRPLAWVGVGAAALAGVAVVVVALVALEVIVEGDPDPPAAVAPPPVTPTSTATPTTTPAPTLTAASPTPSVTPEPSPVATPPATPSLTPTPTATPPPTPSATPTPIAEQPSSTAPQAPEPAHSRLPPTPTFNTPPGTYTAIAVGVEYIGGLGEHACALTESGQAVCWTIEDGAVWDTPAGSYTHIATVARGACATTTAGDIVCWAVGGGPILDGALDPSRGAPTGQYAALSSSGRYTCGLTEARRAVCWGPDGESIPLPTLPDRTYTTISLGDFYAEESDHYINLLTACSVAVAGDLVCWRGSDSDGEVEQSVERSAGDYTAAHVHMHEVCTLTVSGEVACDGWDSEDDTRYTSLSVGGAFVCAVTEGGSIRCQNHDIEGLYIGEFGVLRFMNAPELDGNRDYASVSVGASYACALTDDGEAVCWGAVDNKVARPAVAPGRYMAATDGYGHTCALTDEGDAVCWGWNNFGQADVPDGRYTAISAGFASTCALTEAGEAVCWGTLEVPRASDPQFISFLGGRYQAIATGYDGVCAVTEDGEPICAGGWGLGPKTPSGSFAAITLSWTGRACAVSDGGTVVCWPDGNREGQLDVPPGSWTTVDAGDRHICGTTDTGGVYCWGDHSGRLPGTPEGRYVAVVTSGYDTCVLTDAGRVLCAPATSFEGEADFSLVSENLRVLEISIGLSRVCGVTEDGAVVCWGDSEYGGFPWMSRHGYQPSYERAYIP